MIREVTIQGINWLHGAETFIIQGILYKYYISRHKPVVPNILTLIKINDK
jgi:hypothetical protein